MCDNGAASNNVGGVSQEAHPATGDGKARCPNGGGKPSGVKDMKICNQLDRTKWCQQLPRGHHEEACHLASTKRKQVLQKMKELVKKYVNSPVCPEWDTSETCENTPGPYRFGVVQKGEGFNDNYKIIGSRINSGCDCIKRNGLQDDCRLPRCRGSPACKITPFPRCEPFRGIPASQSAPVFAGEAAQGAGTFQNDRICRCPH